MNLSSNLKETCLVFVVLTAKECNRASCFAHFEKKPIVVGLVLDLLTWVS